MSDAIGGNATHSSGCVALVDSDLQRQTDSPEAFFQDLRDEVDRQRARYGIVFEEGLPASSPKSR